jgi:hypothetical protein
MPSPPLPPLPALPALPPLPALPAVPLYEATQSNLFPPLSRQSFSCCALLCAKAVRSPMVSGRIKAPATKMTLTANARNFAVEFKLT